MREIVLDTETTGLDPFQGHRVVEIGCIELVNRIPSGQTFHRYINPERDMPAEAFAVHGLAIEFLKDKPLFADVADELLAFIGDAPLVAHNASFDLGFLNAELERAARPAVGRDRLIDTLLIARRKFPGGPNRLDDLCLRFGIDNSRRTKHGALLDAEILADVYLDLIDARQAQLGLVTTVIGGLRDGMGTLRARARPTPLLPRITEAERAAHRAFITALGATTIWSDYLAPAATQAQAAQSS
jgi:DNA polymerase III subunit epsilon